MNATSIVVGGSTAKQIDCGSVSTSMAAKTIYFNFTFTNVPTVVCTPYGGWTTGNGVAATISAITTTYFVVTELYSGGNTWNYAGGSLLWIAIG